MTEGSPTWQRALPFLALVPAPAAFRLGNAGSLGSLAIVLLALAFVKGLCRPTFAFVRGSWWLDILIGIGAGLVLAIAFDHLIDPVIKQFVGPIKLDNFSNVRGNLPNFLILLTIAFIYGGLAGETVFRGFIIGWGSRLFGGKSGMAAGAAVLDRVWAGPRIQGLGGMVSAGLTPASDADCGAYDVRRDRHRRAVSRHQSLALLNCARAAA